MEIEYVPQNYVGRPRKDGGQYPYTALERRLARVLHNIEGRCSYPGTNRFEYYGGRGIQNFLTLDDLKRLWRRDRAKRLKRPSIDRIDPKGHYIFENCRFIELAENSARTDRRRYCRLCGVKQQDIRFGLCPSCKPPKQCIRCKSPRDKGRQTVCGKCRFVTRPCAWCGQMIRRDTAANGGWIRNKQWFCSKREQGRWFGTNYGNRRV